MAEAGFWPVSVPGLRRGARIQSHVMDTEDATWSLLPRQLREIWPYRFLVTFAAFATVVPGARHRPQMGGV